MFKTKSRDMRIHHKSKHSKINSHEKRRVSHIPHIKSVLVSWRIPNKTKTPETRGFKNPKKQLKSQRLKRRIVGFQRSQSLFPGLFRPPRCFWTASLREFHCFTSCEGQKFSIKTTPLVVSWTVFFVFIHVEHTIKKNHLTFQRSSMEYNKNTKQKTTAGTFDFNTNLHLGD